ncbi:MAG TPA: glycosyltransferase family 2 protein [Acidimicrobiales bacterium]|nr:glycosyltransferase family 2 protein [Acidimicrobiales bacterium]
MIGALALIIVGLGMAYFLMTTSSGVLFERRRGKEPVTPEGPEPTTVFFLIGCLNEELVIEETVERLLVDDRARVVVVDDGSDDRTSAIAAAVDADRVTVLRRELPNARLGKGKALNDGFARINEIVHEEDIDPSTVLVCVMDADGHLSRGCLDKVLPLFRDPDVGGAQLIVRIRNRDTLLGLIQDIEFFGLTATCQIGRVATGTVSLGGNGQFARLTALNGLDGVPWSESLTEDLDLTISMLTNGWKLTTTDEAHVTQQGVEQIRPLIKQRTRWYQGHMTCGRRLPELWRSRALPHGAVLEVTAYLAVPWLQVLPWSILFHLGIWQTYQTISGKGWEVFGTSVVAQVVGMVLWYLLIFFPNIVNGSLYFRRVRSTGLIKSLALGHLLILAAYISYAACWRALYRMVVGRTGWDKTRRAQEMASPTLFLGAAAAAAEGRQPVSVGGEAGAGAMASASATTAVGQP